MSITIGTYTFPVVDYDAEADVLYLKQAVPDGAVDWDDTPEGHGLRFGPGGELVGITLLHPRWLLEHEGQVTITLPQRVEAEQLDAALVS